MSLFVTDGSLRRRALVATGIVLAGWLIAAGRLLEWVVTNEIERA